MVAYGKYANINNKTLTVDRIEMYMKYMKTHCNISDIENGLIEREYALVTLC